MLKNASSLAIVGLDTAENGPSKVRQVTNRIEAIIGAEASALVGEAAWAAMSWVPGYILALLGDCSKLQLAAFENVLFGALPSGANPRQHIFDWFSNDAAVAENLRFFD